MSIPSPTADSRKICRHRKIILLRLQPEVWAALVEACVTIGDRDFLAIVNRHDNGALELAPAEMPVVMNYLKHIDQHLSQIYPHHDDDQPTYNAADDDAFQRDLEVYRHPLVYELFRRLGADALLQYSCDDWNVDGNTSVQTQFGSPGFP